MIELSSAAPAAARWLLSLAAIIVIGHSGAEFACRRVSPSNLDRLAQSLTRWLGVLLVAVFGVLAVQAHSWFGSEAFSDFERLETMITATAWGEHWLTTAVTVSSATLLSFGLRRGLPGRRFLFVAITMAVVLTVPLVGHGGATGAGRLLHTVHLAGVGLWIGTLAVLLMTVWPTMTGAGSRADQLAGILKAFSPLALGSVAVMGASGFVLSVLNVGSLNAVASTSYGQTLLLKVAAVAGVAGIGWFNWRTHTREGFDAEKLRRRAAVECLFALVVVLAFTAWLGGLEIPAG